MGLKLPFIFIIIVSFTVLFFIIDENQAYAHLEGAVDTERDDRITIKITNDDAVTKKNVKLNFTDFSKTNHPHWDALLNFEPFLGSITSGSSKTYTSSSHFDKTQECEYRPIEPFMLEFKLWYVQPPGVGGLQNTTRVIEITTPGTADTGSWGAPHHFSYELQHEMRSCGPGFPGFIYEFSDLPPLKQAKLGVASSNVVCKPELELLVKTTTFDPVCLRPSTASVLSERNWAIPVIEEQEEKFDTK